MAVVGKFSTFERDVRLATRDLEPTVVARELAAFAKAELRRAIDSGEASPNYDRYVNGRQDAPEESVIPPGPIVYVFGYWPLIIRTAIEELRRRVPVKTGRYAGGFLVLANGVVAQDWQAIDAAAEVVIFNVRPYTRKMEVGANRTGARHFDGARSALNRQYKGTARAEVIFLTVSSGVHIGVPYILKGSGRGRRGATVWRRIRKDRAPGQPITYPALVINMVQ